MVTEERARYGRFGGDDRGGGVHHDHEFLRLRRDLGGGERIRGQREAGQDVGIVAHDQLLREALGDLGGDAADVLADDLDLLAGDGVAVLLHVEFDPVVELEPVSANWPENGRITPILIVLGVGGSNAE